MHNSPSHIRRVAIVGTGLIGGSVWLRLAELGADVVGWDPDAGVRDLAESWGLRCTDTLEDAIVSRDLVLLGAPLHTLPETLEAIVSRVGGECLVTDVGSTKAGVLRAAAASGYARRFIGGHPMAGTEGSGMSSASPALFHGAPWVLCTDPSAELCEFRALASFLIESCAVRIVPMKAERHDATVALSSHLPHLVAGALTGLTARSTLRDSVLGLAAGSFRDGTRVAGTMPERVADMLTGNLGHVRTQLAEFVRVLADFSASLERQEAAGLIDLIGEGHQLRHALLSRPLECVVEKFSQHSDVEDERAFLDQVGTSGGYVTDCRVTGDVVVYTAELPVLPPDASIAEMSRI